jgi:hypothetical protein
MGKWEIEKGKLPASDVDHHGGEDGDQLICAIRG